MDRTKSSIVSDACDFPSTCSSETSKDGWFGATESSERCSFFITLASDRFFVIVRRDNKSRGVSFLCTSVVQPWASASGFSGLTMSSKGALPFDVNSQK